jgi:hypothetical protein
MQARAGEVRKEHGKMEVYKVAETADDVQPLRFQPVDGRGLR